MKYPSLLIILLLFAGASFGQLTIKKNKRLIPDDASVIAFLKNNKVDSALIVWFSTSSWPVNDFYYYCLLKQSGNWYFAKLKSPAEDTPERSLDEKLNVRSVKLSPLLIDSLLKAYKPDAIFRYTQADFNKLPVNPTYKKDSLVYDITINDGGESHLGWFRHNKFSHINYFEPGTIFRFAYPYVPEYLMLSGFVKCTEGLLLYDEKLRY